MFLFIIFSFTSCDHNQIEESITDQISKIETDYQIGDVKVENLYVDGVVKNETVINPVLLDEIEKSLEQRLFKNTTRLKYLGYNAAVFKSGTCQTAELVIKMDSEDSDCNSKIIGWVGDSYRDGSGNLYLKFCACNISQFSNHKTKSYGLLQIEWTTIDQIRVQQIYRHFDNEDKNNANGAWWNGVSIKNTSNILPTQVYKNTDLVFLYLPAKPDGITTFPTSGIGASYGVLGDLNGDGHGYIYSDDEDSDNANFLKLNYINVSKVDGAIIGGSNTKMYISQILNGNSY